MAPVGPQDRFWDLSYQPAQRSSLSSPASSASPSPTRNVGPRKPARTPLSNGWQLPSTEFKFTLSDSPFNNPFPDASPQLPGQINDQSTSPPTVLTLPPTPATQGGPGDAATSQNSQDLETLTLEEERRPRRTSITFNPKVTLDCGHETRIEEPVPKDERWNHMEGLIPKAEQWQPGARPRGRSLLQELSTLHHSESGLHRAQSDSDRTNYDSVTGKPLLRKSREWRNSNDKAWPLGDSRHPLLKSTVDALARDPDMDNRERMASLTSASTASPVIDEAPTPKETQIEYPEPPVEYTLSPVARPSPLRQPTSLETSSAWPMPRLLDSSSRARSFNFERSGSLRRGRKTASRRSSQASSFLSTFGKGAVATAGPDDEGQEVCEYVMGKQIGYGGFSVVKEAFTIENSQQITRAVKIVRKRIAGKTDRENEQAQAEFEHEVSVWRILNHRFILPLIAVYDTPFATYCFMPLNAGGSLFDLMRARRSGLPANLARRYGYQLASALRYLHEDVRIAHRDIKLENCLLDKSDPMSPDGNILLCDFGMAEYLTSEGSSFGRDTSPDPFEREPDRPPPKNIGPSSTSASMSTTSTSIDGSLHYACPELILSQAGLYSSAVDMWAFGIVIHTLLAGKLPFQHTFLPKLQMMILKGEWSEDALQEAHGNDAGYDMALELVKGCLDMDPAARWTCRQVLQSRWLEGCNELYGMEVEGGWSL